MATQLRKPVPSPVQAAPKKDGFWTTLYKWGLFIEKCVYGAIWATMAVILVAGGFAAYTIWGWVSNFDYKGATSRPAVVASTPVAPRIVEAPPAPSAKPLPLVSTPQPEAALTSETVTSVARSIPTPSIPKEPDNRDRSNPPGDLADYVWVNGHTRADGKWVEGHWRKRTASDRAKPQVAKQAQPKPESIVSAQPRPRIWVEGYTRKNGTKVKGYWRDK